MHIHSTDVIVIVQTSPVASASQQPSINNCQDVSGYISSDVVNSHLFRGPHMYPSRHVTPPRTGKRQAATLSILVRCLSDCSAERRWQMEIT